MSADPSDPTTAFFRQTRWGMGLYWFFELDTSLKDIQQRASRSRPPVQETDGPAHATINWKVHDGVLASYEVDTSTSEPGFISKATFTSAIPPEASAKGEAVDLAGEPVKPFLTDSQRDRGACDGWSKPEQEALAQCLDQVPADLTVGRWLVGRTITDAITPPVCQ